MAHSRAICVLDLLELVGWLILELLCTRPAGASRVAHSRAICVLDLLEPVGWLILELFVYSTCWS